MAAKKSRPAKDMFVDPRKAMQSVAKRKKDNTTHWLYFLVGFMFLLSLFYLVLIASPLFAFIAMVIFAWPVGYVVASFYAWTLHVTGRLLKGKGNFQSLRKAYLWGMIPCYWLILILIPYFLSRLRLGDQTVTNVIGVFLLAISSAPIYILGIWSMFSTSDCIAIVQKFNSTTKGWINHFLGSVLTGLILGIVFGVLFAIFGSMAPDTAKKSIGAILGC